MQSVSGILIERLPFIFKEEVGILFFKEYPVTTIFGGSNSNAIIKEWVDCSDDGLVDRYIYYETKLEDLKLFIDGKISFLSFINSALNGIVFIADESNSEVVSVYVISASLINLDYLPQGNLFFNSEDGVDIEKIIT